MRNPFIQTHPPGRTVREDGTIVTGEPPQIPGWRVVSVRSTPWYGRTYDYTYVYAPLGIHLMWKVWDLHIQLLFWLVRTGWIDCAEGGTIYPVRNWRWDRSGRQRHAR